MGSILNLCFVSRETILCLIIFIKIKNVSRETFFKSLVYLIKNILFWLILAKIMTYPQFINTPNWTLGDTIIALRVVDLGRIELPSMQPAPSLIYLWT